MLVTDCVLVADDDCCADGLLAVLRDLPGVVAVLGLPLSNILFASARGRVREYRRAAAGSAGRAVGVMDEVSEGLSAGRETLDRSEEHTSELQSLMRHSYAVFCLTKIK